MNSAQYKEVQRIDPVWILGTFAFINVINYLAFMYLDIRNNDIFYPTYSMFLILLVAYMLIKLETIYSSEGIQYRFFPFHRKFRMLYWKDLHAIEIVKIRPIRDFGGWGIRKNKGNAAFTTQGNITLSVTESKSGKKTFIGIKDRKKTEQFLREIKIL
jgi:hypothetical protein